MFTQADDKILSVESLSENFVEQQQRLSVIFGEERVDNLEVVVVIQDVEVA